MDVWYSEDVKGLVKEEAWPGKLGAPALPDIQLYGHANSVGGGKSREARVKLTYTRA